MINYVHYMPPQYPQVPMARSLVKYCSISAIQFSPIVNLIQPCQVPTPTQSESMISWCGIAPMRQVAIMVIVKARATAMLYSVPVSTNHLSEPMFACNNRQYCKPICVITGKHSISWHHWYPVCTLHHCQ